MDISYSPKFDVLNLGRRIKSVDGIPEMTKQYVDSEITLEGEFRNSSGALADPTAVTFTYRMGRDGTDNDVTPVKSSTGIYTATMTPDIAGMLYGVFEGTGALVKTVPVQVPVYPKQLPVG